MDAIPHWWDLSPREAIALQTRLAAQVDTRTPIDVDGLRWVAGVDVSVKGGTSRAAIVVLTFPGLELVETVTAALPTAYPYVPGLLSFREGPAILAAGEKLRRKPDAYLFDGQGIAHPRRLGIAAHVGLWWDAPTVGCGKTRLVGRHGPLPPEKGAYAELRDRGEAIGCALRTRANVKPVYVSPGHRATPDSARELVMRCLTRYRLPEPIRAAHHAAGDFTPDL